MKARGQVRPALLEIGTTIGYLRWASQRQAWSLKFDGLDFSAFVSKRDLAFSAEDFYEAVREHQGQHRAPFVSPPSADAMAAAVEVLAGGTHDPWHVCCGHDLVEILSIALRRVLGQCKESDVTPPRLELELRLAYEAAYWNTTQLRADILSWEAQNSPFSVL